MKKLSIVFTSRNDAKSGDELVRMQAFIDSLFGQYSRFNLDIELILVEWNQPYKDPSWPKYSSGQKG